MDAVVHEIRHEARDNLGAEVVESSIVLLPSVRVDADEASIQSHAPRVQDCPYRRRVGARVTCLQRELERLGGGG
jgi:hypothetical protein